MGLTVLDAGVVIGFLDATDAAALRAKHGSLKLPDALVIATARMLGADLLVTTDRKWPTPQRLQLGAKIRTL